MIDTSLRFLCERSGFDTRFHLYIGRGSPVTEIAKLEFVPRDPAAVGDPGLDLTDGEAQSLIDELWAAGLRPTQGRQSEGAALAQSRHLEDMRALAFGKIGIAAPGEKSA